MKFTVAIVLLFLAAPGWAGDNFLSRETLYKHCMDNCVGKGCWEKCKNAIEDAESIRYEHKIIPEPELEKWLNDGWEFVLVYTVEKYGTHFEIVSGCCTYVTGPYPVNKAVIKRKLP